MVHFCAQQPVLFFPSRREWFEKQLLRPFLSSVNQDDTTTLLRKIRLLFFPPPPSPPANWNRPSPPPRLTRAFLFSLQEIMGQNGYASMEAFFSSRHGRHITQPPFLGVPQPSHPYYSSTRRKGVWMQLVVRLRLFFFLVRAEVVFPLPQDRALPFPRMDGHPQRLTLLAGSFRPTPPEEKS